MPHSRVVAAGLRLEPSPLDHLSPSTTQKLHQVEISEQNEPTQAVGVPGRRSQVQAELGGPEGQEPTEAQPEMRKVDCMETLQKLRVGVGGSPGGGLLCQ